MGERGRLVRSRVKSTARQDRGCSSSHSTMNRTPVLHTPPVPNRKLTSPLLPACRKLKVFEEVMITSKRYTEAQRVAQKTGMPIEDPLDASMDTAGPSPTLEKTDGAVWDAEASERRQEAERERDLAGAGPAGSEGGIVQQTGSTWDRLRQQSIPARQSPSSTHNVQPRRQQQQQQQENIDISALPSRRPPQNPMEMSTTTQSKYAPGLSVEEKIEQEVAEERRREQEEFERYVRTFDLSRAEIGTDWLVCFVWLSFEHYHCAVLYTYSTSFFRSRTPFATDFSTLAIASRPSLWLLQHAPIAF